MHGASIGNRGNIPGGPGPGNRAPHMWRSLYVVLTMTILIGLVW